MTIVVKNMNPETNEFVVESIFSKFGEVDSARVIYDRHTNESKGIAFIEMSDEDAAKAAIEKMNGTTMQGFEIEVAEAEDRSKKFKIRF